MKKQLIAQIAQNLKSFGYTVYISKNGEYGFYTDGKRVVSFGGCWSFSVDFSGNYRSKSCGTGWILEKGMCVIDACTAERFIKAGAPMWATKGESVTLTTPEQYLKTYGSSSGFTLF